MLLIDILSLPGVEAARDFLLSSGDEDGVWISKDLVDDLIRAVADAVETKLATERTKAEDDVRAWLNKGKEPTP